MSRRTLCLNMIVKDESHIIEQTLTMLTNKIQFDYWVICDTGSSDNTPQIIETFFRNKNIPGELLRHTWVNFAHNRTLALQAAYDKTDYLFVFDADDDIVGDVCIPPLGADADGYNCIFGGGSSYNRLMVVNNHIRWKYLSVVHEFISCESKENPNVQDLPASAPYYFISGRGGSRNKDPQKYLKDAFLLEAAHKEAVAAKDPLHLRYAFYCANSYKDYGDVDNAIKWYLITLSQDNWSQEKYYSCLQLFHCYNHKREIEKAHHALMKSYQYETQRAECTYEHIKYYCCEGMHLVAYNIYRNLQPFYENHYLETTMNDKLFLDTEVQEFLLPYYMIIVADNVKHIHSDAHDTVRKMFQIIFTKKHMTNNMFQLNCLFHNFKLFYNKFPELVPYALSYIDHLHTHGIVIPYENISYMKQEVKSSQYQSSKNMLIYTGFSDVLWNYTYSKSNALGGSEMMASMLGKYLADAYPEYTVYVAGNVAEETVGNMQYINLDSLEKIINTETFYCVIVSRYVAFYERYSRAKFYKSFIWAHDTILLPYGGNLGTENTLQIFKSRINKVVCLTEWHHNFYQYKYPMIADRLHIIRNGIREELFCHIDVGKKIKNKFIYSSCRERGLDVILNLWNKIREELPGAELYIASYNNDPAVDTYGGSVHYLGKLSRSQLYAEMETAEYWFYPTDWPETSCITAMEMLACGVICVYYPVAALPNTIRDYGLIVHAGEEIQAIKSLTDDKKKYMSENGREFALHTYGWNNVSKEWDNLLFDGNRIAIFNSFPFHYEMFGFILYYAKVNKITIDVFTTDCNNIGWLSFYKTNVNTDVNIYEYGLYEEYRSVYDYKFVCLPTDDDPYFKKEWYGSHVFVVNHTSKIRNINTPYSISCARLLHSNKYAIPSYPIATFGDKKQTNIITVIGGSGSDDHLNSFRWLTDVLQRIDTKGEKWTLHVVGRSLLYKPLVLYKENMEVIHHINLEMSELHNLLTETSYMMVHYRTGNLIPDSVSGALHMAFDYLCMPMVYREANQTLQIENAIEFDIDDDTPLELPPVDFRRLEEERERHVRLFSDFVDNYKNIEGEVPKHIVQVWNHKNISPEFQTIVDTWKILNPTYGYTLFDQDECRTFIAEHYGKEVVDAYDMIRPGAAKCDLFTYCYLFINGGVYTDIDTLAVSPIDIFLKKEYDLLTSVDLNVCESEGTHNLVHGFIACKPRHPAIFYCIRRIVDNVYNYDRNKLSFKGPLDFTGPGVFGRAVNEYLGREETASFMDMKHVTTKGVHLLHFETGTEYVKNKIGQILFQNKNGNPEIIRLYGEECAKCANYVPWTNTYPIAK